MNNSISPKQDQARQYASDRIAALFDQASGAQQIEQLAAWKAEDPVNAAELDAAIDLWGRLEDLEDDPEIVSWGRAGEQSIVKRWRSVAIAAMLLLSLATVFFVFWSNGPQPAQPGLTRYITAIGENRTIGLPDGSVINMNTDSRLLVDYTDASRRIILDRGEAYFDVAKVADRPFTVDLGSQTITVLGTQFNVKKIRSLLTVAVLDGVIALHPEEKAVSTVASAKTVTATTRSGQYNLSKGSVLTIDNDEPEKISILEEPDVDKHASWRTGKIRFIQQPLYKVVQEMNRYTTRKVILEDARVMNLNVTAVLHLDDMDSILVGLEESLPITVNRYPDSVVIVSSQKG